MAEYQKLRTDDEVKVIRSTFENNEVLLRGLRQFFFQLPVSAEQQRAIDSLTEEQVRVIRMEILPSIADDRPVGMSNDIWATLDMGTDEANIFFRICQRERANAYLAHMFDVLQKKADVGMQFNAIFAKKLEEQDPTEVTRAMAARLSILATVEKNLYTLWLVGNQPIKSPLQVAEANRKNDTE